MSQLQKLSIQAIRSFGPLDQDVQIITFFSPVTLIVGPNGTGKTSVIECLRYSTTGEMPPGTKQSGAFVHDPKIANETEIKGQVRLVFKDVVGKTVRVQRSLTASVKGKSVSVRTLEGVIIREGDDGSSYQVSSRCADLDKEIMSSLGISKAILENVIFCHQDECNWPLGEARLVKTKFDDIFAATKYTKTLEGLRKIRQEKAQDVKLHKAEMMHLTHYKKKATEIRAAIEDVRTKEASCKDSVHKIKEALEPIEKKLETITKEAQRTYEIQKQLDVLLSRKSSLIAQIDEMSKATDILEDNLNVLKCRADELDEENSGNILSLSELEEKKSDLSISLDALSKRKTDIITQVAKLESESAKVSEMKNKKLTILNEIKQAAQMLGEYEFPVSPDCDSIRIIDDIIARMKRRLEKSKNKFSREETNVNSELDKAKEEKTKIEQTIFMKQDAIEKSKNELLSLKKKIDEVQDSENKLRSIDKEISLLSSNVNELEIKLEETDWKTRLDTSERRKHELNARLKECGKKFDIMMENSKKATEVELAMKEKEAKELQMRKLLYRNEETFKEFLGSVDPSCLLNNMETKLRKVAEAIVSTSKENKDLCSKLTVKEERRKYQAELLLQREKERHSISEQLTFIESAKDLDKMLSKYEGELNTKQDEKGFLNGVEKTYERFITQLQEKRKETCCPLCCRPFKSEKEAKDLISEMERTISNLPQKRSIVENQIKELERKFKTALSLKPVVQKAAQVDSEIPVLKKEVEELLREVNELKKKLNKNEEKLAAFNSEKEALEAVQSDVFTLNRTFQEIKELDMRLKSINLCEQTETLDELRALKENLQEDYDCIVAEIDTINSEHSESQRLLLVAKEKLAKAKNKRLEQMANIQDQHHIYSRLHDIEENMSILHKNVSDLRKELSPLNQKIAALQEEKSKISHSRSTQLEKENLAIVELESKRTSLEECSQLIDRFEKIVLPKLKSCLRDRDMVAEQFNSSKVNLDSICQKIDETKQRIRDFEKNMRVLQDNIRIREKEEELRTLQRKIDTESKRIAGLNLTNLAADEKELRQKQENLVREKHVAIGRLQGFETQLANLVQEMQQDCYRLADENYNDALITIKTLETVCFDIDKFYKALDRSVISYHSLKMAELNKIIRDLWRNTYRGNDIDYIEIRSELDDDGSGAAKARRTYNYHVVMIKGGLAIEMRSRCSAGQKVLASIIIRLALAEAFGIHCGIVALDEPTTNLDRENIESLACALIQIIESRCVQKNFQIIVITHDEDFVEMLSRSSYVDKFYRMQKDDRGLSKIVKCDIRDLR